MTILNSPKIKAKTGDVFLIPIDSVSWVLAQIIDIQRKELYVAIYADRYFSLTVEPRSVIDKRPHFLVLTLDSKLFHGMWLIIGNVKENLSAFPEPAFKVDISGHAYIVSRNDSICRLASKEELTILKLRSVRSPQGIENMLQSYFSNDKSQEDFDYYLAKYAEVSGMLL
jgi:hypothetical protein